MPDLSDKICVKSFIFLILFSMPIFAQDCCDNCSKPQDNKGILDWLSFFIKVDRREPCPPIRTEPVPVPIIPEPEWPLELIKVTKVDYQRNEHASFCKRPTEIVDTIVIHHSETPSTNTAQDINRYHLDRGTPQDPWYMIAYSYVVNSPYPGNTKPIPVVTEGRPMDLVGAHAGTNIFIPMDENQKKLWDEGKVTCGKNGEEFKVNPEMVKDGKIKANVTTLGLVVVGNYAPMTRNNPNGYTGAVRNPSSQTLEMVAKMSCQLQKKHPTIKYIKYHSMYHATSCPGNLKNFISKIAALAKGYGCAFN